MVELGGGDDSKKVARLHMGADIDIAFRDIPARAREDVCGFEGVGGGRQSHAHRAGARPHCGNTHIRNEVVMLLRDGSDFEVPRVMPPDAKRECAE